MGKSKERLSVLLQSVVLWARAVYDFCVVVNVMDAARDEIFNGDSTRKTHHKAFY